MVNQVLLEHVAPSLDDVQQRLLEWFPVNFEPMIKHFHGVDVLTFLVDLLVRVDLCGKLNYYEFRIYDLKGINLTLLHLSHRLSISLNLILLLT